MSRLLLLNSNSLVNGKSVIYVMSRDQRVHDNHALLLAQKSAIKQNLPLVVVFNLLEKTGYRSREHFNFMITGLRQVEEDLAKLNIQFALTIGDPVDQITKISSTLQAAEVIFDLNPLSGPRNVQKKIAKDLDCRVSVVDAHNIIPLWVLSDKEEYAAHTIRSKVHKQLDSWLNEYDEVVPQSKNQGLDSVVADWEQANKIISKIPKNTSNIPITPGEKSARIALDDFIENRLENYALNRNIPTLDAQSNLSPYLHFGHLSSQRVALEVTKVIDEPPLLLRQAKLASFEGEPNLSDSVNAFLEELIVRKELADNYCFYNPDYKSLDGAKDWAKNSLEEHRNDKREFVYKKEQWESASTHDEAWNAAQNEMMKTGKMHGYMRMYWAKKILEWSSSPEEAIETAIALNDTYSIDGGDPNGYTGIMWSIAGIHDRPWFDREVYGKIRYMNRGGLERRFKVDEYIEKWRD